MDALRTPGAEASLQRALKDAGQLEKVFADLLRQVVMQRKHVEISAGFAALGALLVGAAMVLSFLWIRSG